MSEKPQLAPPQVRWDLSHLFTSQDDPRIDQTWEAIGVRVAAFEKNTRGLFARPDLTATAFAGAIAELEAICTELSKPLNYASLIVEADSSDPANGAFYAKQQEKGSAVNVKLMFFELELQAADEALIAKLLEDPALATYRHYVQTTRALSPYRLSEPEEVVLEEVSNTGSRAWVRLFEEVTANHTYRLSLPGESGSRDVTQQDVLSLLRHPDRATRQAAADSFSKGLKELERVLVFTYNTLLQDHAVEDRLRRMEYPERSRHLNNELDKETVDLVIKLCRENYSLVERFYIVKKQILGIPELTHIDRYAPLFETEEEVAWEEAKKIVLDSFGKFSPEVSQRAAEFFEKNWIDAEPRKGKRGGAFCSYCTPDTHPVVFQSYMNKMDDVMTLAHELGHGVHASFSREQSYFNFHGTLPLAELASTFGEMLVFESLVAEASTKDKLALYADKVESVFATIFRQAAMFRFEQRVHELRRTEGELTPDQFGDVWQEEQQAMFGNSITLGEQHRTWWSYVGHFIFAPFYVYAYSFGELLVLSLYQMAKAEGPSFQDKYISLLKLGGSLTPFELMETVGVDLKSEEFWLGGFAALEALVAEFERLWSEVKE